MTSHNKSVAIAELAIYVVLVFPILYLLFIHGKRGLLGWLYVFLFASLRLVSAGLTIGNPASTTGAIISSVGLSPLLLALAGLLHEAHEYLILSNPSISQRKASEMKKLGWAFQLFLHATTVVGIALVAVTTSNLSNDARPSKYHTDLTLRKVGSIILLLVFFMILAHAFIVHRTSRAPSYNRSALQRIATRFFHSITAALPFILVRLAYTVATSFSDPGTHTYRELNPLTASLAINVIFPFLIPLLAILCFVVGGFMSRKIATASSTAQYGPYPNVGGEERRMDHMVPKQ